MGMPGFWELMLLALLALLIFGPDRLPGIARSVGKTVATLRKEASGTLDELKAAAEVGEFREVADDVRATTADLKRSAALTGPVASSARPRRSGDRTAQRAPADFDPDAT